MTRHIQIRRDAAANWTAANTVLESGEWGLETDTKKLKIGDGSTAWNDLAYFSGGSGGSGDVTGPSSATDGDVVIFNGATGKIIKESSIPVASVVLTGDARLSDTRTPKTHASTHSSGMADPITHGNLAGLSSDDHLQYIKHSLATAANDFLVASGAGVFVKKTLTEIKTLLGLGTAAYVDIDTTAADITMNGTRAAGSVGKVADAGHVHPVDTSRAPVSHSHAEADITNLTTDLAAKAADSAVLHKATAAEIYALTSKGSPTASDLLLIEDVADSNNKKKITIGSLPSSGGGAALWTALTAATDFATTPATYTVPTITFTFASSVTVVASSSVWDILSVGMYIWNSTNDTISSAKQIIGVSADGLTITLASSYTGTTGSGKSATAYGAWITMNTDKTGVMGARQPISYTYNGVLYYGIVDSISATLLKIRGPAILTGTLSTLSYGDPSRAVLVTYVIPGAWGKTTMTALLNNLVRLIGGEIWDGTAAYAVAFSAIQGQNDSGANQPTFTPVIGGNDLLLAPMPITTTLKKSSVGINPSNYAVPAGTVMEGHAVAGSTGDAYDLKVQIIFVRP